MFLGCDPPAHHHPFPATTISVRSALPRPRPPSLARLSQAFAHPDAAYVLSFALIMLNTDLHNPAVRKKMSLASFIKMNRGVNGGQDVPDSLLACMYSNVKVWMCRGCAAHTAHCVLSATGGVLDGGCWVLGAGCWVLGAGCWVLGAGCWVLGAGCWVLRACVLPVVPCAPTWRPAQGV
jgi:hypothetical protein